VTQSGQNGPWCPAWSTAQKGDRVRFFSYAHGVPPPSMVGCSCSFLPAPGCGCRGRSKSAHAGGSAARAWPGLAAHAAPARSLVCALAYADPWPDLTVLPGPCVAEAGVTRLARARRSRGFPHPREAVPRPSRAYTSSGDKSSSVGMGDIAPPRF
jgi:hypothetical protein